MPGESRLGRSYRTRDSVRRKTSRGSFRPASSRALQDGASDFGTSLAPLRSIGRSPLPSGDQTGSTSWPLNDACRRAALHVEPLTTPSSAPFHTNFRAVRARDGSPWRVSSPIVAIRRHRAVPHEARPSSPRFGHEPAGLGHGHRHVHAHEASYAIRDRRRFAGRAQPLHVEGESQKRVVTSEQQISVGRVDGARIVRQNTHWRGGVSAPT